MEIPNVDFTFIYLFFFFAIPGLVFRKFYYQGEFSKQFVSKNWAYTLTTSFVIGIVIQLLSFYSLKGIFQVFGKPEKQLYLIEISDFKNVKNILEGLNLYEFNQNDKIIFLIVSYILFTCLLSFISAFICWHSVRRLKLDRKFKILRFSNIWNYYLRGEIVDFKDFITINENKKVLLTLVDIVISDGFKENKLFSGILTQYTINPSNTLETITLTDVHIWKKDKNPKSDTYNRNIKCKVKGHCLILDVKKSIDLNLTYVYENQVKDSIAKSIANFITLLIISSYLVFIVFLIISSNPLLIVNYSVFYTILLKTFLIFILTLIMSVFFNLIDYLGNGKQWSINQKSEKLKGGIVIIIFLIFLMLIYRLVRYGDFYIWML